MLFKTGAQRSNDANHVRYDLFHPMVMDRVARVWAEGAAKYGEMNYERGMPFMVSINHCLRHIFLWLSGDDTEDHLAHSICNLFMAMHSYEYYRNETFNLPGRRLPGNKLSEETIAWQEQFKKEKAFNAAASDRPDPDGSNE